MFDALLATLVSRAAVASQRVEGVAFFRAAKELYRVASLTYVCVNIPAAARTRYYAHCFYSDTMVKQCVSPEPIDAGFLEAAAQDVQPGEAHRQEAPAGDEATEGGQLLVFALPRRVGETALFGVSAQTAASEWEDHKALLAHELRTLASYFHGHILRINGNDSQREILMSARELDCLKWTAAGKTAWEASIILGISERTVRFHLNAAREKLNCATTTQAVAKAVANHLIDI
jgi:DNA-binding CsgD family transcriptional regulator